MADELPRRGHLRRLDEVRVASPIYFVTTCVAGRRPLLANAFAAEIIRAQFEAAPRRYGWTVGRYVVMPDHAHFFCSPGGEREPASLSTFVAGVKMWSARGLLARWGHAPPFWQREFFDHLLRGGESYDAKWTYFRDNPVRAGLARRADGWPYAGEIAPLEFIG